MGLSRLAVSVQSVRPDCSLEQAARLMIRDSVHALLVTNDESGVAIGILTGRDLVRQIASGADVATTTVGDFMSRPVTTLPETASRAELTAKMRAHGFRHIPLVDESGAIHRIVSLEDLLCELGEELEDLSAALRAEFRNEVSRADDDPG
jgi:CBS domain-containing protein